MQDWAKLALIGGGVLAGVGVVYATRRRGRAFGDEPRRAPMRAGKLTCPYCSQLIQCEPERGLCSSSEFYGRLLSKIGKAKQESFWVAFLDARNEIIGWKAIAQGTVNQTLVHPRDVFREAIKRNASAVIVAHNHPSGASTPSPEDESLTRRLIHAGAMVGIPVLDHLVVAREGNYHALREERPALWQVVV